MNVTIIKKGRKYLVVSGFKYADRFDAVGILDCHTSRASAELSLANWLETGIYATN